MILQNLIYGDYKTIDDKSQGILYFFRHFLSA